uniref:Golgin B1 n=1 Tax=Lepisosteus oculatus TaxID=7918 RepID=W5NEI0_LEPOC
MLSRLAQGVNSVLQELSGEENPEGSPQDGLVPSGSPDDSMASEGPGVGEDVLDRLAQTEQLVVQLKEVIRERDAKLQSAERQLKEEREAADAKLSKLKLQAKAKVVTLNKQIEELKGQGRPSAEGSQSPDVSLSLAPGLEEELQQLRLRLQEEESVSRTLREQLEVSEQRLREKEESHAEQLRVLQAVVCEKDARFQEQVQRHEEELLRAAARSQAQTDSELQQALRAAQRRTEELEESLRSRSQVLEVLQQEILSADQQKQILTAQFRQMEAELTEAGRQREEQQQRWADEAAKAEAQLAELRGRLEAAEGERAETAKREEEEAAEISFLRERLEAAEREMTGLPPEEREEEKGEGPSLPSDPGQCLSALQGALRALETKLSSLSEEKRESEARCSELAQSLEALQGESHRALCRRSPRDCIFEAALAYVEQQEEATATDVTLPQSYSLVSGQLHKSIAEGEESAARIQQLEEQITTWQVVSKLMDRSTIVQFKHEFKISILSGIYLSLSTECCASSSKQLSTPFKVLWLSHVRLSLPFMHCSFLKADCPGECQFKHEFKEPRDLEAGLEGESQRDLGAEFTLKVCKNDLHHHIAEGSPHEHEEKVQTALQELKSGILALEEHANKKRLECKRWHQNGCRSAQHLKEQFLNRCRDFRDAGYKKRVTVLSVQTLSGHGVSNPLTAPCNGGWLTRLCSAVLCSWEHGMNEPELQQGIIKAEERIWDRQTMGISFFQDPVKSMSEQRPDLRQGDQIAAATAHCQFSHLFSYFNQVNQRAEREGGGSEDWRSELRGVLSSVKVVCGLGKLYTCSALQWLFIESCTEGIKQHLLVSWVLQVSPQLRAFMQSHNFNITSFQFFTSIFFSRFPFPFSALKGDTTQGEEGTKPVQHVTGLSLESTNLCAGLGQYVTPSLSLLCCWFQDTAGDPQAPAQESEQCRPEEEGAELTPDRGRAEGGGTPLAGDPEEGVTSDGSPGSGTEQSAPGGLPNGRERGASLAEENGMAVLPEPGMDRPEEEGSALPAAAETPSRLPESTAMSGSSQVSEELVGAVSVVTQRETGLQEGSEEHTLAGQNRSEIHFTSWEGGSFEQSSSTDSAVQKRRMEVWGQQGALLHSADSAPCLDSLTQETGHLAELEGRCKELQAVLQQRDMELQNLREAVSESQRKTQEAEGALQALLDVRKQAEAQMQQQREGLEAARAELSQMAQLRSSELESRSLECGMQEEQLRSLETESRTKDQKIQALQADMDRVQRSLAEQEGLARALRTKLGEREEALARLQELSEAASAAETALAQKAAEIGDLKQLLAQKEQEMRELNDGMSSKLVQAGEERFALTSQVAKLRGQLSELEKALEERERAAGKGEGGDGEKEDGPPDGEELESLRKESDALRAQMETMKGEGEQVKRKLQAALVHRKELMKKMEEMKRDMERREGEARENDERSRAKELEKEAEVQNLIREREMHREREEEMSKLEAALEEARQHLIARDAQLETLKGRIAEQDQAQDSEKQNAESQTDAAVPSGIPLGQSGSPAGGDEEEKAELRRRLASLEAERESLQRKLQEALASRKDTIRKAKEKDRHHREQLKQQKDDYNGLLERCEEQGREREGLLQRLGELEGLRAARRGPGGGGEQAERAGGGWGREDWVDFAGPEEEQQQQHRSPPVQETRTRAGAETEAAPEKPGGEALAEREARLELERRLQEAQAGLALRESELGELREEVQGLREKELQIDTLSGEIEALREKCLQAEANAEALRSEVEGKGGGGGGGFDSPIAGLQAEVEEFKAFLSRKNEEISELSRQLGEQNALLQLMQETVSEKDQLIASLQHGLRAEEERRQKLEAELPARQPQGEGEGEGGSRESRLQQLQRKLQAALISRKEALKESKALKEELAAAQREGAELRQKLQAGEAETERGRVERKKLIEEVDRALLENQSLGASCESLKLAMEGVLQEKDAARKEAALARETAARETREWADKLRGLQEEYETLLRSYENVSDEAERVRRVLEAARQERQELAARARAQEAARREAEERAEEARGEVEAMKEKMRKFARSKQQKILELEEENEKLREREEGSGADGELERARGELKAAAAELEAARAERDSIEQEANELRQRLEEEQAGGKVRPQEGGLGVVEEPPIAAAQQTCTVTASARQDVLDSRADSATQTDQADTLHTSRRDTVVEDPKTGTPERSTESESTQGPEHAQEEAAADDLRETSPLEARAEGVLGQELASLEQQLQESQAKEVSLRGEAARLEAELQASQSRLEALEAEKDDLEERLMNQLAQLNGSIAAYQQEAAESCERLAELEQERKRLQESEARLERERAEWEAEAEGAKERAARLEEDKRQAQRERAEAEAEAGRQRELEEKLKSAQRGREGSQSHVRQLQELLREKQMEVRQLQKDSIRYQERISSLEKTARALTLGGEEARRELEAARLEVSASAEGRKRVEAELATSKVRLDDAQSEAGRALAEKRAAEDRTRQREGESKAEAERRLEAERQRLGAALRQAEQRLEEALKERERQAAAAQEARQAAEGRGGQAQQLQSRLDEALARLAAFSRAMSSLQDDRDRVLDEAKQWESRFHSALQAKEAEVRQGEAQARELEERLLGEAAQKEELQGAVDRSVTSVHGSAMRVDRSVRRFIFLKARKMKQTSAVSGTLQSFRSQASPPLSLPPQVMMEKDALIQEAAGENNSLKGELRSLLAQRDDLNAEKAKLSAELHGYRDDLTQVLSMKESQHRQLLSAQLERVGALEREREQGQARVRELESRIQELERERAEAEGRIQERERAEAEGRIQERERAEAEGRIREREERQGEVSERESEAEELRRAQERIASLERELRWDAGVTRTQAEAAEERVAELSRDLLETEQRLLSAREEAAELRVQSEAFGRSMASLQDARDEALSRAQALQRRLEELEQGAGSPSPPAGRQGEVQALRNALAALQSDRERLLEELQLQKARCTTLEKERTEAAEQQARERTEAAEQLAREKEAELQELETLRQERTGWQSQAELLKQQFLVALSDKEQQIRDLSALLQDVRSSGPTHVRPKVTEEQYQREGSPEIDSAPGAPQERNLTDSKGSGMDIKELLHRLEEERERRQALEEELGAAEERLKRSTVSEWMSQQDVEPLEHAVLIEPPEGAVTKMRSGGPGLCRTLRSLFCSRQRTPLLATLYLLTVHVLLVLCMGGYL